jgi:hypothetical protein
VAVGHRPARVGGDRVLLFLVLGRLGGGDQFRVRPQVRFPDLDEIVALLPQGPGDGPVAVDGDVHGDHAYPEVLHLGDDLRQVLLGADDQGVGDRLVTRESGQVAPDLAFHSLAPARPLPAQAELEPGEVGQRVMLGAPAPLGRRLVPVAAQQREPGAVAGNTPEELQQSWEIPGNRLPVAGPVDGHRAIRQHVACVHEQRAPIHRDTVLPSRRDVTSAQPAP